MTSQSINKGHVENAGGGTCAASKIPGGPWGHNPRNPRFRRPMLYPIEPRVHVVKVTHLKISRPTNLSITLLEIPRLPHSRKASYVCINECGPTAEAWLI